MGENFCELLETDFSGENIHAFATPNVCDIRMQLSHLS